MPETTSPFLPPWSGFFIMTGTSAASLIGLMFVVITLVTRSEREARTADGLATFSTPTVLHFAAVLLISAAMTAPWHSLIVTAVISGLVGLYGIVNVARAILRSRNFTAYAPDMEDWVWYWIMPLLAYGAILGASIELVRAPQTTLFVLAGGVLLLVFIGIRNAWDIVTFLVIRGGGESPD
jgi:hypothetical protein